MKISRRSFLQRTGATLGALWSLSAAWAGPVRSPHGRARSSGEGVPASLPDISFVQVSDTHIPDPSGVERSRKLVRAVDELSLPYDFIVHTGDVTNGYGKREEMTQARELLAFRKETVFVPGNHDVTFDHSEEHEATFESVLGPCYHSAVPVPGLRFAFFDSQALSDGASPAARERAWRKLDEILSPAMPTIFFCHAPGLPDFYRNEVHPGWKAQTLQRWTARMREGGVFAVLAGHFHRAEMHWCGDLPFHVAPPVVGWWGRQTAFRHWTLRHGRLSCTAIYV